VLDVSRHQGRIDWQRAARRLLALGSQPRVAIRATVGDYYTDPRFADNWAGAVAAGFRVTAYHVVTPERDPGHQIARFMATVGAARVPNMIDTAGWVLDCELTRGQSPAAIADVIEQIALHMPGNQIPAIYTRASWWDVNIPRSDAWRRYPLWVAHYDVAIPRIPADWDAWTLWQYSADGNGRGAEFGAQSDSIDLSYYVDAPVVPPPEPAPGIVLHVSVRRLNLRDWHSTHAPKIGVLSRGDALTVTDVYVERSGVLPTMWAQCDTRIGRGWCAVVYRGYGMVDNG